MRHLIPLLLLAAATPGLASEDPAFARYASEAKAVVDALDGGATPASQRTALESLTDQAATLIPPFSHRHTACAAYLDAALALRTTWPTLSIDEIERDYHHDAALPAIADPRAQALCYQMKDLLVHPITALRMLQEPAVDTAGFRHEIVEVVAHGHALGALMAQP